MYAQGACSKIASAILTNPTKRQLYAKNICYNTVFHILKEADPGFGGAKTELAHPEVKSVLFDPRSFTRRSTSRTRSRWPTRSWASSSGRS